MLKFRYAHIIFFNLNPVGYAHDIKRASSHLKSGYTGRTIHVVASHTWNSGPALVSFLQFSFIHGFQQLNEKKISAKHI